jgi:hypothetical protein
LNKKKIVVRRNFCLDENCKPVMNLLLVLQYFNLINGTFPLVCLLHYFMENERVSGVEANCV